MSKSIEILENYIPNTMHFEETITDLKKIMPVILGGLSEEEVKQPNKKIKSKLKTYIGRSSHSLIEAGHIEDIHADIQEFITKKPHKEEAFKFIASSGRIYGWHSESASGTRLYPIEGPNIKQIMGIQLCELIMLNCKDQATTKIEKQAFPILKKQIAFYKKKKNALQQKFSPISSDLSSQTQPAWTSSDSKEPIFSELTSQSPTQQESHTSPSLLSGNLTLGLRKRKKDKDRVAHKTLVGGASTFKSPKIDRNPVLQPSDPTTTSKPPTPISIHTFTPS